MSMISGNPVLDDPVVASKLSLSDWLETHLPRFVAIRPRYEKYEHFLDQILRAFCRRVAPLAIVQARAKGKPSFAEKILRKHELYAKPALDGMAPDPLVRLTDLCGGRVIVQTAKQGEAICRLIEQCFDIDWANSDDASTRLKATEFGYRTINYIVMPNPEKLAAANFDITIPPELLAPVRPESALPVRLKAEIQVRTLLEHAYADIGHDLTYKTEVKVPDRVHRSFSALAAILETADQDFARLVDSFNDFKSNYGAYQNREQVEARIERLRVVLEQLPDDVSQAVQAANLALSIGDFEQVIELLKSFEERDDRAVQRGLGMALTGLHWDSPRSAGFCEGRKWLEAACAHQPPDAELLGTLAECWAHSDHEDKAEECFRQALAVDAAEPFALCRYLELQVRHDSNDKVVRLAEPMIRNAITRCLTQIEGRVNLAHAWSSLVVFRLLVGDPFGALDALANFLCLCAHPSVNPGGRPCAGGRSLARLRKTLAHMRCLRSARKGFEWVERAALLGMAVRLGDDDALAELRSLATPEKTDQPFRPDDRIVIQSGGCAPEVDAYMPPFMNAMCEATTGLSFTVVSGGTRMGISGVAAEVARRSKGRIRAVGYLPRPMLKMLHQIGHTQGFDKLFPSEGSDFTPLDPLQAWIDLVVAGVDPGKVKLIGYAGGLIAKAECALALALGARVGVVENQALPKERQFTDPAWTSHRNFLPLPLDAMTLHVFLRLDGEPLSDEDRRQFEGAARQAHEDYVRSATPRDASLKAWTNLNETLKLSNYHQVLFWKKALGDVGLAIRPLVEADTDHPPLDIIQTIGKEDVLKLAAMEHGRWNVERLGHGWRFDREKDVVKRRSPYLIPWDEVPPDIQEYDVQAVRGLPVKFREAGLELYRTAGHQGRTSPEETGFDTSES